MDIVSNYHTSLKMFTLSISERFSHYQILTKLNYLGDLENIHLYVVSYKFEHYEFKIY